MKENESYLRMILAWILSGHVITAVMTLFSREGGIRAGQRAYGAEFEPTDQFAYILRPAGAYVTAMAFLQAMALREPRRYKAVIDATLIVFGIRGIQRLLFQDQVAKTFGISPGRHWATTIYFQALAALLLAARMQMKDD